MEFKPKEKEGSGIVLMAVILMAALLSVGLITWERGLSEVYSEVPKGTIQDPQTFDLILKNSKRPIAIEFSSKTCPACIKMEPYWLKLVRESENLPVDFYIIYFDSKTSDVFARYGITETPTYAVFVDGKLVTKRVGTFAGDNITNSMYLWAIASVGMEELSSPEKLALSGLDVFNEKCSSCHGKIESLDRVEEWLSSRGNDDELALLIRKAVDRGLLPREIYGGFDGLRDAVTSMRKYVPLSAYEIERSAYLIDYVASKLLGREAPEIPRVKFSPEVEGSGEATSIDENPYLSMGLSVPAYAAGLFAGLLTAFSPCVFPIFLTNLTLMVSSGKRFGIGRCATCSLSAALGALAIGAFFVLASGFVMSLQSILLPLVGFLIMTAGLATLLGSSMGFSGVMTSRKAGITGFCALYGFLAIQCNIFIIVGVMLLVAGLGNFLSAVGVLLSFAIGVSVPLGVVMYLAGHFGSRIKSLAYKGEVIEKVGGAALFIVGLFLLLSHYIL